MTMLERMTKELRRSNVRDAKAVALRLLSVMRVPSKFMVDTLEKEDGYRADYLLEAEDFWPIMIDAAVREAEAVQS